MRYDLKGQKWDRVKRKTGWPSKSSDPLERKQTTGIGLHASSLTRAFKPSRAERVQADPEKRTDKALGLYSGYSREG